jgi:branched-chain amino acid transport system substrate-binding protein
MEDTDMPRVFIVFVVIVFSLLVIACSPGQPKGEVIVYVAAPLSGFQANGGQTVAGGVRLAAEQINRAGGLLGYKVTVVALDDESDSDVAVSVAEQVKVALGEGKRILGVIGHYNSGQTLAAMKIYKDLPLIVITPTSSEVSLTKQGYRNFFRINANDAVQAQVDADFLVKTLNARRIGVMHNDTEYGVGLRDQMRQALAAQGAEVVQVIQVKEGQDKYDAEVSRLQAARPDAIFYAGYEIECPYLRYALKQAGVTVPFLASDGCFLAATIDESSGAAEGMYVSSFAPSPATVVDPDWMKAYQAIEYRNPDTYSVNGYAAMSVLAEAVKKAGSLEANRVANTLHTLDINTLVGPVSYDNQGDLRQPKVYIFQVQNGSFVQVAPASLTR